MINEWQPTVASLTTIDIELLRKFARISHDAIQQQPDFTHLISSDEQQKAQEWLRYSEENWQQVLQQLDTDDLFPLAVFFTIAEQQISGWQCGSKNPAIWVFRMLRHKNILPERSLIRQLKQLTDNRYIPYGSVL